jgi:gluconokinase
LDLGTSSIRGLLFDLDGNPAPVAPARRAYHFDLLPDGGAQADPDLLLDLLFDCIDETLDQSGRLGLSIQAVGMCTFVSNLLGVDAGGRAVTPLIPYFDNRPVKQAAALRASLGEAEIHQRTGCRLHPSYLPARLLWLAEEMPQAFHRSRGWMSLGEYAMLKLFGERAASFSLAAWSGLLNRRTLEWDQELLAALPVEEGQLSQLRDYDRSFQDLLPAYRERWPGLAGVPWLPAIGDGAAANLGSGCWTEACVAISIGTSSAVRVVLGRQPERLPPALWCYRVDRKRALLGGALSEGGNLVEWLHGMLQIPPGHALEAELAQRSPGGHGLAFLPLLAGERSPGWALGASGALSGLTLATRPVDFYQAALEGLVGRLAQVFQAVRVLLPGEPQVVASGGAVQRSDYLAALLADILGIPVSRSPGAEPSARGVALLAIETLGLPVPGNPPGDPGQVFQPRPERTRIYQEQIARQQKLYVAVVLREESKPQGEGEIGGRY